MAATSGRVRTNISNATKKLGEYLGKAPAVGEIPEDASERGKLFSDVSMFLGKIQPKRDEVEWLRDQLDGGAFEDDEAGAVRREECLAEAVDVLDRYVEVVVEMKDANKRIAEAAECEERQCRELAETEERQRRELVENKARQRRERIEDEDRQERQCRKQEECEKKQHREKAELNGKTEICQRAYDC